MRAMARVDVWARAHHIRHWADGGRTDLSNLMLRCSFHHRAVHEGGYRIQRERGEPPMVLRPDGSAIAPPSSTRVAEATEGGGAALPRAVGSVHALWAGEHLDLAHTIDALLSLERLGGHPHRHRSAAAAAPGEHATDPACSAAA